MITSLHCLEVRSDNFNCRFVRLYYRSSQLVSVNVVFDFVLIKRFYVFTTEMRQVYLVKIVGNQILSIVTFICCTQSPIHLRWTLIWKTSSLLSSYYTETVSSRMTHNICKRSVWLLSSRRMSLPLWLLRSWTKLSYCLVVWYILMNWLSIFHCSKLPNLLLHRDPTHLPLQHLIVLILIGHPGMCKIITKLHKLHFFTIFFPVRHVKTSDITSCLLLDRNWLTSRLHKNETVSFLNTNRFSLRHSRKQNSFLWLPNFCVCIFYFLMNL